MAKRAPATGVRLAGAAPAVPWWPAAVLVLAIAVTYANSLGGPFVLDDEAAIVTNGSIRDLGQPWVVLLPAPDSPVAGRPLANLTFALNYAWGGLGVTGYHVVNIALHAACALLLMAVIRRTLAGAGSPAGGVAPAVHALALPVAAGGALLWALHPLNSEVVDYLSQRTESLMTACFLATLYAAIRARASAGSGWVVAAWIACALGMLSKETMVVAPVVVALYDRAFLYGSWREAFAARRRLYAGLAATWLILAALVAGAPRDDVAGFGAGVTIWTNLLNQAVMIVHYLRLFVWPDTLVAIYGWHLPLTAADVLPQALIVLALLAATIVALLKAPGLGFAGAWFFLTLAPSSSIIAITTEVGAERRMYLPSAALAVLAVAGLLALMTKVVNRRLVPAAMVAIGVIAAALGWTTVQRNREYASAVTLAQTIVDRRPTGVAYHILGEQLRSAKRPAEAIAAFREAVVRGNSRAHNALGMTLFSAGEYGEAIEQLEAFIATAGRRLVPRWLEPSVRDVVAARLVMGSALLARGDGDRGAAQAEAVLREFPRHVEARGLLGAARFVQQRWPDVRAVYGSYLSARPDDIQALVHFGVASVAVGAFDEAIGAFQRAVAIDPKNDRARQLLGMALRDRAAIAADGAGGPDAR